MPKTTGGIFPSVSCEDTMPKTPLARKARTMTRLAASTAFALEGRTAKQTNTQDAAIEPPAITREGEPTICATPPKNGAESSETP